MANISTKLDLLKIPGARRAEVDGKKGKVAVVQIPIEYANLYNGEKGVYLDLIGFDVKSPREGSKDTHLVKQSLPKEKQTDDMPILGNHIAWGETKSEPKKQEVDTGKDDDLPF